MQLKAWIDSQERFKSVSDAARELEVSPQHLHYILKGERNPSWNLIRKIVEVSGGATERTTTGAPTSRIRQSASHEKPVPRSTTAESTTPPVTDAS